MSYNLLAISEKRPDWNSINSDLFDSNRSVEMFPIKEEEGKFFLGLSIPSSKMNKPTDVWKDLERTVSALTNKYGFKVFDLYGGFYVEQSTLDNLKKQLLGE